MYLHTSLGICVHVILTLSSAEPATCYGLQTIAGTLSLYNLMQFNKAWNVS